MSKQRFFSTSFNGYNKVEVTRYIEEQASEFQNLQELADKQKKDSQEEISRLKERIAKLESMIEEENETPEGEIEEEPENKDDNINDDEKRMKYYDLCVQMGEKLLNAEASSQLIVNDANERAEKIVETAKIESKNLIRQTAEQLRQRSEIVYEAIRLHQQKEMEIRGALDLSLRRITELIASIEELGSEDD